VQCFDTVGWVILPAKTVPEMTYNVFSGTLNPTHFTSLLCSIVCNSCAQCNVHTHERTWSCLLVRFSFSVVILCVTIYLCYI